MNFEAEKIPLGDNSPQNVYSVPAQETATHRAKFGWPPVSDIAAATKPVAKPVEITWGAPNNRTDISR